MAALDGRSMSYAARLDFPTTSNASKYEALLLGLRKAKALGAKCVIVKSDSSLMAGHFDKTFATRDPEMARYLAAVRTMAKNFLGITVQPIPRGANEKADRLVKMVSSGNQPPPEVFYEVLNAPSVIPEAQGVSPETQGAGPKTSRAAVEARGAPHLVMIINEADWRDKITSYLTGEEPEDSAKGKRLRHQARNYSIVDDKLYKGGVCTPLLTMHIIARRARPPEEDPQGSLKSSSDPLEPRREGLPSRFSLANDAARLPEPHTTLPMLLMGQP